MTLTEKNTDFELPFSIFSVTADSVNRRIAYNGKLSFLFDGLT